LLILLFLFSLLFLLLLLFLPLLHWTWLCLYHLIVQASGQTGLPLRGFATHGARTPSVYPQLMPLTSTSNQDYLIPGTSLTKSFPRMHALLQPSPQHLLLQGPCPMGHLSPALATRPGCSCAFTILNGILVQ
jgi:hypothetical protein